MSARERGLGCVQAVMVALPPSLLALAGISWLAMRLAGK